MPVDSPPLNNPPTILRLHQINSKMPFGQTNYVPEEETRNLRANFPEPDILEAFKELATDDQKRDDSIDTSEPLLFSREVTLDYCHDLCTNPLSHPNYRELAWHATRADLSESIEFGRRTKARKVPPATLLCGSGAKKSSSRSGLSTSQLESRYRFGHVIPFWLNSHAACLIQHAAIMGQRKRVARELGTSVVYLNDRNHLRTLGQHRQAQWERKGDLEHRNRAHLELQKARDRTRDATMDLLPPVAQDYSNLVSSHFKQTKSSPEKFPDYWPEFTTEGSTTLPPKMTLLRKTEIATNNRPSQQDLPIKESNLTGTEQSDSIPPSRSSSDGILSSRLSMRNLYDKAELSVKVKKRITKRYLKYKGLSWDR